MISVPFIKRLGCAVLAVIISASTLTITTSADQAYDGYNYDWWEDAIPSQNGYVVDKVVSGIDLGVESLDEPSDLFVDNKTGDMYIVDSKNNRIVVTEETFDKTKVKVIQELKYSSEWSESDSIIKKTTLNKPTGVFVTYDMDNRKLIYIADASNNRVVACYEDGTIWMEYTRPSETVYDSEVTFEPKKVIVDSALNVYVCIKSITDGAVVFEKEGSFTTYYGANRVEQTLEVIQMKFWKMIFTKEQIEKMFRNVAVEFSNFDIDDEGFIYTVTELKSADTDVLKKLNPAGTNIFVNLGYDGYVYGDMYDRYYQNENYTSSIVDVEIDADGKILLLDFTTGRVFEYDEECYLLFIFGGRGTQKGLFTSPNAVETYKDKVYVIDGRKCSLTVFKRTEFGDTVHSAMELYNKGLYGQAKSLWEQVLKADANYRFAYIGIGQAYLEDGDYEEAMHYFYRQARGAYNRAFKGYRMEVIRANFTYFAIGVIVLIVGLWLISFFRKRAKQKKLLGLGGN